MYLYSGASWFSARYLAALMSNQAVGQPNKLARSLHSSSFVAIKKCDHQLCVIIVIISVIYTD